MKCEMCHQHEATIAYTHVVESEKKTLHLCSACVSQQKARENPKQQAADGPAVAKKVKAELKQLDGEGEADAQCTCCGMSYEEFKKAGRFGCHVCYEAFEDQLVRLMKRIHGTVGHQGKGLVERREPFDPGEELEKLREELQAAVAAEAYEKAAGLRDRIRELETVASGEPGT